MLKLGVQVCVRNVLCGFMKSPVVSTVKKENFGLINAQFIRKSSFFNRCTKKQLWKGVLSVSNAGKKKGRGKGRDNIHKVNSFYDNVLKQKSLRVSWPGFNSDILSGNKVAEIKELSVDKKPRLVHPEERKKKSWSIHPLDRGWSGRSMLGRKLGPPLDSDIGSYKDFESVVLVHKANVVMTSLYGRRRQFLSVVAIGNGSGLLGLGLASKFNGNASLKKAKDKASTKLIAIDLIETHTVNHDFFSECNKTKLFVYKRPKGYGLRCHRAIKELCRLIGIKDLYAKVEGPCNVPNVIRAFVVGLLEQKTYQQIADEKKLHLVEFKEESYNYPQVLASPKECLSLSEARKNPVIFNEYIMGGRTVYKPDEKVPFFQKLPSWRTHLLKTLFSRNHDKVKIDLLVKYGACSSHLTEIYPESRIREKGKNTLE